jgi:hypothetical protein
MTIVDFAAPLDGILADPAKSTVHSVIPFAQEL